MRNVARASEVRGPHNAEYRTQVALPERTTTRVSIVAAAAASTLLLASGAGYRALAWRLGEPGAGAPIARGTLRSLPLEIGTWMGRDAPLDEAVVRAADVDDYVNRVYVDRARNVPVGLFVALGVRGRDLMPHRPEVCYPGAGWTLRGRENLALRLADGTTLPGTVYTFAPGSLDARNLVVLDYYVFDGGYAQDVRPLRLKAWRGQAAVRYVAQVQLTARVEPSVTTLSARQAVCALAADSAARIRALVESARPEAPAMER